MNTPLPENSKKEFNPMKVIVAFSILTVIALGILAYALLSSGHKDSDEEFVETKKVRSSNSSFISQPAQRIEKSSQKSDWNEHSVAQIISNDENQDEINFFRRIGSPSKDKIKELIQKKGVKVRLIKLVEKEKSESETLWTYHVKIRISEELVKPKITSIPNIAEFGDKSQQIRLLPELERGKAYSQSPDQSLPTNEIMVLEVKVQESEEETLISANPFKNYLTGSEWKEKQEMQVNRISILKSESLKIQLKVDQWRRNEIEKIPKPNFGNSSAKKWNHGSGSGEPTRTAARVGGGTAAAGAVGAIADSMSGGTGTTGGLIGAGLGLLGGFAYDTVSKNADRKKFDAQEQKRIEEVRMRNKAEQSAYDAAKTEINRQAEAMYSQEIQQLIGENSLQNNEKY